jgi:hypothetical protein
VRGVSDWFVSICCTSWNKSWEMYSLSSTIKENYQQLSRNSSLCSEGCVAQGSVPAHPEGLVTKG